MMYLDLEELPRVFDGQWAWSVDRPRPAWFRRSDYLGDPQLSLDEAVRRCVAERVGRRPEGPIRMLTHLRYFGYCFNPVTFYFCYDRTGNCLEFIISEITNTPWAERHTYIHATHADRDGPDRLRFRFGKEFHISPFMDMDIDYDWQFTEPGSNLAVHMTSLERGRRIFDATMVMERREINSVSLRKVLWHYPLMTVQVITAIHWQALRLKLKGCRFYTHPAKRCANPE